MKQEKIKQLECYFILLIIVVTTNCSSSEFWELCEEISSAEVKEQLQALGDGTSATTETQSNITSYNNDSGENSFDSNGYGITEDATRSEHSHAKESDMFEDPSMAASLQMRSPAMPPITRSASVHPKPYPPSSPRVLPPPFQELLPPRLLTKYPSAVVPIPLIHITPPVLTKNGDKDAPILRAPGQLVRQPLLPPPQLGGGVTGNSGNNGPQIQAPDQFITLPPPPPLLPPYPPLLVPPPTLQPSPPSVRSPPQSLQPPFLETPPIPQPLQPPPPATQTSPQSNSNWHQPFIQFIPPGFEEIGKAPITVLPRPPPIDLTSAIIPYALPVRKDPSLELPPPPPPPDMSQPLKYKYVMRKMQARLMSESERMIQYMKEAMDQISEMDSDDDFPPDDPPAPKQNK